jgi:hypothetical protein
MQAGAKQWGSKRSLQAASYGEPGQNGHADLIGLSLSTSAEIETFIRATVIGSGLPIIKLSPAPNLNSLDIIYVNFPML